MALDAKDLGAIEAIIAKQLKPIQSDIASIKKDIEAIKEWVPTENSGLIKATKVSTSKLNQLR